MEEDTKQKVVRDFIENRKRMLNEMNDDEKKAINEPPTMEKIMKVINSLGGVSEEDKEKLRKRISERSADGAGGFSSDFLRENVDALRKRPKENLISVSSDYEYYLFIVMIVLVLLVFVFFGYKLYKSLTDRDRKREEKRLAKQSKKKK